MLYQRAPQPLVLSNALITYEERLVETQLAASEAARLPMTQGKTRDQRQNKQEHSSGRARFSQLAEIPPPPDRHRRLPPCHFDARAQRGRRNLIFVAAPV